MGGCTVHILVSLGGKTDKLVQEEDLLATDYITFVQHGIAPLVPKKLQLVLNK